MGDYKRVGGFGGKRGGGFRDRGSRPNFGARPNYGGGRPSFGGRSSAGRGNGRDGESREMFQATCVSCHKSCEVPFRPSGDKPVYCSDCFAKQRSSPSDFGRRDDHGPRERFPKREFSPSFVPKVSSDDKRLDDLKKQLDVMAAKVDTIFRIVSGRTLVTTVPEKQPKKKVDEKSVKTVLNNMMANASKTEKKPSRVSKKKSEKKPVKKSTKKKITSKKK